MALGITMEYHGLVRLDYMLFHVCALQYVQDNFSKVQTIYYIYKISSHRYIPKIKLLKPTGSRESQKYCHYKKKIYLHILNIQRSFSFLKLGTSFYLFITCFNEKN